MALLFMDGFDTGIIAGKWTVNDFSSSSSTRFGVGKSAYGLNSSMYKAIPASDKVIVGYAFSGGADFATDYMLTLHGDSGTTQHLNLRVPSPGQLELRRGDYNDTLLGSASIPSVGWTYLEISATIADSGGVVEVRANGVTVINFTGDTKNGGTATKIDTIMLGSYSSRYFDDVYICDDTGTTNNTFLGDVRVQTLVPTGAGSSTQFTPTGGANYANVADIPDSIATYNSSSTVGNRDTYAMADVSAATGAIYGVQNSMIAWKSDAGSGAIKTALKAGSTVYYDSTIALGSSPGWHGVLRETNPATSTAWTVSDVNSAELGAEVA